VDLTFVLNVKSTAPAISITLCGRGALRYARTRT
jgi:hypothetical protein